MGPTSVPEDLPPEWYCKLPDGTVMNHRDMRNVSQMWASLSPWNWRAMDYYHGFVEAMCARYNAPDVLCINSWSQEGEAYLPPGGPAFFDDKALASYKIFTNGGDEAPHPLSLDTQAWLADTMRDTIIIGQKIYMSHPSHELFMSSHPIYMVWPNSGAALQDCMDYEVASACQPENMWRIIFSFFDQGWNNLISQWLTIHKSNMPGIKVMTGSEWPDGLKRNTARALQIGIDALLTAPLHPFLLNDHIEPEVFTIFRESYALACSAREQVTA